MASGEEEAAERSRPSERGPWQPTPGDREVPHHISVHGKQNRPQGELRPKLEHGQLQPTHPQSSLLLGLHPGSTSLEHGLT